jgi:hypothetical protein
MAEKITESYVDGAERIHFLGGLVRMDFATLQPNIDDPTKPSYINKDRLIMTPEGFLRTYSLVQQLAGELVKLGVLKKVENGSESAVEQAEKPPKQPKKPRRTIPRLDAD